MTARAITLHPPWASLVAIGAKTILDQAKPTDWRGPLLIHAATRWDQDAASDLWAEHGIDYRRFGITSPVPLGAVVASCQLVDCVPIVNTGEEGAVRTLDVDSDGLALWIVEGQTDLEFTAGVELDQCDVSDQLPFGDFTPGR